MSSSAPSAPSMTAMPDADQGSAPPPGPIIGGVIGGIAVLGGLLLLLFFLRRRRTRSRLELNVPAPQRSPRAQRAPTWRSPAAVERARKAEGRSQNLAVPSNPNARLSVQSLDLPPLAYEEAEGGHMMPRTPESAYIASGRLEEGHGDGAGVDSSSPGSPGWKARDAGVERSESGYGTLRSMTGSSSEKGWKM